MVSAAFERLEDRLTPGLASPPDRALVTGAGPLATALPYLDADGRPDFAALTADGHLTLAINGGANTWLKRSDVDLELPATYGFAFGNLNRDPYTDLVVQTPDGIVIARGDGQGGFGNFQSQSLGAAGTLAGPGGARVEPTATYLAGDEFADVVTIAPGTNEVLVLRGDGVGRLAVPVRLPSGGVGPVSVVAGQFIGDAIPDLAVGHRDGSVTFFQGNPDGSFAARPALTVTGLGTITGLSTADFNGDGELDLAVSGTGSATVLLNGKDPAPQDVLVNGDFSQGLTGWERGSGGVSAGGGSARFTEDRTALLSSLTQTFVVPTGPASLTFDITSSALEAPAGKIPDAFEVSLLDAAGVPLLPRFRADATAFFNLKPGGLSNLAPGVTFDGRHVTVNVGGLAAGTKATLVFDLIGNKPGDTSTVTVDNVRLNPAVRYVDTFAKVPLAGPFEGAGGVAAADGDGDGKPDVVVADGSRLLVFNGDGLGGFTRSELPLTAFGTGASSVAMAPLTAGDGVADAAVGLRGSAAAVTPLTPGGGPALDQPPRLRPVDPVSGAEGAALTLTATFHDPDGGGPYTATVEWGDGSAPGAATVTVVNGVGTVTASHAFADNGTYTARVRVLTPNDGPADFQTGTVTVANAAPSVTVADRDGVRDAAVAYALGSFTDPGFSPADLSTRETFVAEVDWGDGTPASFGRVNLTNGSAGKPTAGTVTGTHNYSRPGVYTVALTVTDDDGGEQTQTFTLTVRPNATDDGVWWVPGNPGEHVLVQFDYLYRNTDYLNELGYYVVDDVHGRVNGIAPGDPGYAAAVLASSNRGVALAQSSTPGGANWVEFPAGTYVAFYLVQNQTTATLLATNPTGAFTFAPHVFFSPTAANGDAGTAHFHRTDLPGGWVQYASEDMDFGGDHDFNDFTFRTGPARPDPVVQSAADVAAGEGQAVAFVATFGDPTPNDSHTAVVDWGDGTSGPGTVALANGVWTVTAAHTYADNGTYTVGVTVTDAAGHTGTRSATATVTNADPTLTALANQTIGVGAAWTAALATFTDPGFTSAAAGTSETFTATVDWGDGSTTESVTPTVTQGSPGTPTAGTVTATHTYPTPGTYPVGITVTDDDGGSAVGSFTVTVVATAPTVLTAPDLTGSEGDILTYTATFTDPDPGDTHTASITWGDGSSSVGAVTYANGVGTVTAAHAFADNKTYPIALALLDQYGLTGSKSSSAVIANVAPGVTPASGQTIGVGVPLSLPVAVFTDPGFTFAPAGTSETFAGTIDWGDKTGTAAAAVTVTQGSAGAPSTGQVAATHTYAQPGKFTATVTVSDDDGGAGTGTFAVTVEAHAPTIATASSLSGNEGQSFTYTATFTDTDPGDTHTAAITWGDGTSGAGSVTYANGVGTVTATHTYADNKTYTVGLMVTDKYGATASKSTTATIANVPPQAAPAPAQTIQAGTPLTLTLATFSDPGFPFTPAGTNETFTATVNWGAGAGAQSAAVSVTPGTVGVATTGSVSGTNTYAAAGNYTVSVAVTDDDGGSATVTFPVTVTPAPQAGLGCYSMAPVVITSVSRATSVTSGAATTADATVVISGTGEPGGIVTVNKQGTAVGTTVVAGDGTWRFDYTGTTLAAGAYSFTATQDAFGPLGPAGGFNALIFQNISGIPDAEGRLAAGGTVTLSNFSVAKSVPASNGTRDNLIAGGALNLTGGQVFNGNAVYGTTRNVSANTTLSQGAVRKESVYNFAAAETYLRGRADAWAGIAATGTTTYTPTSDRWAIAVSGNDPAFNVFTVDGSKLTKSSGFSITAPAAAAVLINVTGTSGAMQNFAFSLHTAVKQRVLFNFPQYTTLTLNSIAVLGSVLAPRADVTFPGGNLDGTLVAKSLTGGGELHHFPFLPACGPTTSPAFTVTVQAPTTEAAPKFFVVGAGQEARYTSAGALLGTNALANATGTPVGVTANTAGTTTWVAVAKPDGSSDVWVYDKDGSVRASWRAFGVTDVRDIATNGTDTWVVGRDSSTNALKVFRFQKGAQVLSGGLEPIASFAVNAGNANPTGLATDGWNVFVTDKNAQGGRVFAYDINGSLLGNTANNPWRLDTRNADPSGVALNPSGGNELWVVDKTSRQVFTYSNGRGLHWSNNGGPQTANSLFTLAAGTPAPEGIADPDPTPITFGQTVTGTINPGTEVDAYTFTAAAGQALYFDFLSGDWHVFWRLTNPSGQTVFQSWSGYDQPFVADEAGAYLLEVSSYYSLNGAYSFRVAAPVDPAPIAVALGDTVSGSFAGPGEVNRYTFAAAAGQKMYLDRLDSSYYTLATVYAPDGTPLGDYETYYDIDTLTFPEAGTYTVALRNTQGEAGAYQFHLIEVIDPAPTTIAIGDDVTGAIPDVGQTVTYHFAGTAGQALYFDRLDFAWNIYARLTAPDGSDVWGYNAWGDVDPVALPATGEYTLAVRGYYDTLDSFEFRLIDVPPIAPVAIAIGGANATGDLAVPGQVATYTFTAAAGDRIRFEPVSGDPDGLYWVLTDPNGGDVFSTSFAAATRRLAVAGTYTLRVDGAAEFTGSFEFSTAYVPIIPQTIAFDQSATGSIADPDDELLYTFTAAAGQVVAFDQFELGEFDQGVTVSWQFFGPNGLVEEGTEDSGRITLPDAGGYSLIVRSAYGELGDFKFTLVGVGNTPAYALPFDTDLTGHLAGRLDQDVYTFTAAAGDYVTFLAYGTPNFGEVQYHLVTPSGDDVFYPTTYLDTTYRLPESGTYTFYAEGYPYWSPITYGEGGPGDYTPWDGNYFLRAGPFVPSVTPVLIGDTFSDTVTNQAPIVKYTFPAAAGQRVFFDEQSYYTPYSTRWRLEGPGGAVLFDTAIGDRVIDLPAAGTYTLTVYGTAQYLYSSFTVKLWDVPVHPPVAIVPDQEVTGTLSAFGQLDHYTVDLAAGERFYLDRYSGLSGTITVTGPGGQVIAGPATGSDIPFVIAPGAGTYTITVEQTAQYVYPPEAADYAFVLRRPTGVALDQTVELAVPEGFHASPFTFTGTTGQRLFLDNTYLNASYYQVYYRLYRPDGSLVWDNQVTYSDHDTFTLDASGTYTLVLDNGWYYTDGTTRFRLTAVAPDDTRPGLWNVDLAGTIATMGQRENYLFAGAAGDQVLFDVVDANGAHIAFQLTGPDGKLVFDPREGGYGPFTLAASGTYTLTAAGLSNGQGVAGNFRVRMQQVPTGANNGTPDASGTSFWLAVPKQYRPAFFGIEIDPAEPSLFVTSEVDTTGVILAPGVGFVRAFTVHAGQMTTLSLPPNLEVSSNEGIENKGFQVLTFDPVTIYGLEYWPYAADAYLAMPADSLGTDYMVMSWGFNGNGRTSEFTVVATQDNTTLTVTAKAPANGRPANTPFTVTLNAGQVYNYGGVSPADADLTGSVVTSDKPVALYGSHPLAYIPQNKAAGNHLAEMLPPVDTWGQRFAAVPFADRPTVGSKFRVLAGADNTEVRINGVLAGVLNRGQYLDRDLLSPSEITTTGPALVGQFSLARDLDNTDSGDPFFVIVPPYEQFQSHYTVASVDKPTFLKHYLNLVVPAAAVGQVTVDGAVVSTSLFVAIGSSGYSAAQVKVLAGSHRIEAPVPVGVTAYGTGLYDGYGYTGGLALAPVNNVATLSLTPEAALGLLGVATPLVATLLDAGGNPVSGVRVDFAVQGVNVAVGFAFTDANGRATFQYVGTVAGADTVTATAASHSDTSTVTWSVPSAPPTVAIDDPLDGATFTAGQTVLITGHAAAGTPLGRVTIVTVNGVPVEGVDAAGRFFARITLAAGTNTITAVARDTSGLTATATIALLGVPAAAPDVDTFQDVSLYAGLTYENTTYNRQTGRLMVDSKVNNTATFTLYGPIAAAFRDFDPPDVTLHGTALTDDGRPYATFDGNVAPGAASAAVRLGFDDVVNLRFTFDVDFLSAKNAPPAFVSTPRTDAVADRAFADTAAATDPNGDAITYRVVAGPAGLTVNSTTGAITWTPAADQVGTHRVDLTADDNRGGIARQSYQITVRPTSSNRAPSFRSVPPTQANPGANFQYLPDVVDPDGDALSFAASVVPGGFTLNPATGAISYPAAAAGTYPITLVADDGRGGRAEQRFVLAVGGTGAALVIVSTPPDRGTIGQQYAYQAQVSATPGLTVGYALPVAPAGMTVDPATGLVTWIPQPNQAGPHVVVLVATAGTVSATQAFVVDVAALPVNRAPVITTRPPVLATRGQAYGYPAAATDPDGDTVAFALTTFPAGMTVDPGTGAIAWTPTAATPLGTHVVTLTATDGSATATQTYLVEVRAPNTAPVVTGTPDPTVLAGDSYIARFTAADAEGDRVTFDVASGPAEFRIDPVTGLAVWRTVPADVGPHTVTVRATDERGASGTFSFAVSVTADTTPPVVAVYVLDDCVDAGTPVTVSVYTSDYRALSQRTLTVDGVPVEVDQSGLAVITPTHSGAFHLVGTATDQSGNVGTGTASFHVAFADDAGPPVVTITGPADGAVVTYLTPITGTIVEEHLDKYVVEVARYGTNEFHTIAEGFAVPADGVLATFDPTLLSNDPYIIRVTAWDANCTTGMDEITVSVTGNAKIGAYTTGATDISIPVAGGPEIAIARLYDTTAADQGGDLGLGWRICALEPQIRETAPVNAVGEKLLGMFAAYPFKVGTRVYLTTPDCKRIGFTFDPVPTTGIFAELNNSVALGQLSLNDGTIYEPRWVADPGVTETLYGEWDRVALDLDEGFGGHFDAATGYHLPIMKLNDGSFVLAAIEVPYNPLGYRLVQQDGTMWHYDQFAGLRDVTDRNGNTLTVTSDGIKSSSGQGLTFERDANGRIVRVIDPTGKDISYTYDANGRLEATHGQDGMLASHYVYDGPDGLMTESNTVRESCGCTPTSAEAVQLGYDPDHRLSAVFNAVGAKNTIAYDLNDHTEATYDANGNPTLQEYDDRGNVVRTVTPTGAVTRIEYDANDNQTKVTDERGLVTSMTYAGRKNVTSITDPLLAVTSFTYTGRGEYATQTDAFGNTYSYTYDTRGNLVGVVGPQGFHAEVTFDGRGRPITVTDSYGNLTALSYLNGPHPIEIRQADGSTQTATYNAYDQLASLTDENGHTSKLEYDGQGRLIATEDALGQRMTIAYTGNRIASVTNVNGKTTSYNYNAAGRMTKLTDPLGGVTAFTYDPNGDKLSMTDANGHTTTYAYYTDRRLKSVADPLGNVTAYEYDPAGNQTAVVDANGHRTEMTYTELNFVKTAADALGNTTSFTYDKVGNTLTATDPNGHTTGFAYDALQHLTSITDAMTGVTTYGYDLLGNTVSMTDALNRTTVLSYDNRSRLVSMTDALNQVVEFGYDPAGNRTAVTDERGFTTRFEFDALNRATKLTEPTGAVTSATYTPLGQPASITDPLSVATLFGYDDLGRLTSTTTADGGGWSFAYDKVGNRTTVTDPLNRTTTSAYDLGNRLVSVTDPRSAVTSYAYDKVGNRTKVTDPLNNVTRSVYDAADRLVEEIDPLNRSSFLGYDKVGNLTQLTDRNGRVTTFGYDALDRRTAETWWTGATAVNDMAFTYDKVGNLLTAGDSFSQYAFTYDDLDRLTQADNAGTPGVPHVVLDSTYDENGNRTAVQDNSGVRVASKYDAMDRLASRSWSGGGIAAARVEFDYDLRGGRTEVRRYDSLTAASAVSRTTLGYDLVGRLQDIVHTGTGGSTVASYHTTYDKAGQVSTETAGGVPTTYTYDAAGQLTGASTTGGPSEAFAYDLNGNRAGTTIGPGNELLSDGTSTFVYDDEGNVIRKTDIATGEYTEFAYDHRNRLVHGTVKSAGGVVLREVTNTYDTFDRRIIRAADVDGAGPQPADAVATVYDGDQPWADYGAGGAVSARYLFGDGMDEILARWRAADGTAWYLTDRLGTVRDLLNAAGAVINHIEYDAFGRILSQTNPAAGDRFAFTGREWDAELGLYYYRARYYDPTTGRFLSRDPLGFAAGDANLYRYVGNRPNLATDPTGKMALTECAILRATRLAVSLGCDVARMWADGRLESEDPSIQVENAIQLLMTSVNALLSPGAGLAFQLTWKALTAKTAMEVVTPLLGRYAGVGFAIYGVYDAWLKAQESGDYKRFWVEFVCTALDIGMMVWSARARCFAVGTPVVIDVAPEGGASPSTAAVLAWESFTTEDWIELAALGIGLALLAADRGGRRRKRPANEQLWWLGGVPDGGESNEDETRLKVRTVSRWSVDGR